MFGRTERLLSRGQRALACRDFGLAEALLREAQTTDAARPHILLYLAHALAEQDRVKEAEAALASAIALAPDAFVFRLHRGIIALDAGDPGAARAAVAEAARLSPDNRLVAGYLELAAWTETGGPPSEALAGLAGELSESFRARVLLRLAETTLAARGPGAALAILEPPVEPPAPSLAVWLGGLRRRDRVAYAEALLARERFEDAAAVLAATSPSAESKAQALLERARRGALGALDRALAGSPPARRGPLLLERYDLVNDLGDEDAVERTLVEWRRDWEAAGAPRAQRNVAAAVIRRLAWVEAGRGRFHEALALCAASRAVRSEPDTAGVEAVARLGLGERRAARHAFEDFLHDALFPLDARLRAAGKSPA
jgi:hypothetical protein